jgi:hypothetical protein
MPESTLFPQSGTHCQMYKFMNLIPNWVETETTAFNRSAEGLNDSSFFWARRTNYRIAFVLLGSGEALMSLLIPGLTGLSICFAQVRQISINVTSASQAKFLVLCQVKLSYT